MLDNVTWPDYCTYTYNNGDQCGDKPAIRVEGISGELDRLCYRHELKAKHEREFEKQFFITPEDDGLLLHCGQGNEKSSIWLDGLPEEGDPFNKYIFSRGSIARLVEFLNEMRSCNGS